MHAYERLSQRLISGITDGRIRPGERLPSVRELQRSDNVGRNTALATLRLLEQQGYAVAKPRSGYFATLPNTLKTPVAIPTNSSTSPFDASAGLSDMFHFVPEGGLNLSEALLDNDLLPMSALNRASRSVLAKHSGDIFGELPPINGTPQLRQAIAARMLRAGADVDHNQILITNGATEAVALALEVLTQPGDTVAVECPSYFGNRLHTQQAGLALREITTFPRSGLCVEHLRQACEEKKISAVVVSANVQNPTGACMPNDKRQVLLALAEEFDFWIIEDDVYGDYARYSGTGHTSIKALDTEDRVVYCSSFSKTISPGLRCGWVTSKQHFSALRTLKLGHTLGAPMLNQLTLAKYLATASIENHLNGLVKTLDNTRAIASQAVAQHFAPGTEAAVPDYGFLIWLRLPPGQSGSDFARRAAVENIYVMPGARFGPGKDYDQYIRLNFGKRWSEDLAQAVTTLGRLSHE